MPIYNEFKPHGRLHYLTPFEVLNGEIPDRDRFKKEFEQAKVLRMEKNRKTNCEVC
jgi:hypothetical protein